MATGGTQNTGLQAPIAPDAAHRKDAAGGTNDSYLVSTNKFNLNLIDTAREAARTLTPAIRPVHVDGKEYYVAFLHDYQVTDMSNRPQAGSGSIFRRPR